MTQETLFGVGIKEKKEKKFEVRSNPDLPNCFPSLKKAKEKTKIRKPARKRGTITIHLCDYDDNSEKNLKNMREKNIPCPKIKGFAVDFDGHNEGSGTPCKNEVEVMKQVEYLRAKHKEKYILDVVDERVNQQKVRDLVKGKKVIVKVKYGLDTKDKRDFDVSDNRRELGIDSCLGGCHSSACGGNIGEKEKTFEEMEKEAIDWVIEDIIEDGIPRENIEIIKEEMSEGDLIEHEKWKADRRKSDLEYAERDIKEYSEKLKKALQIKYGYPVVIRVMKGGKEENV